MWSDAFWLIKKSKNIAKIIYNKANLYLVGRKKREVRNRWLADLASCSETEVEEFVREIERDHIFLNEIKKNLKKYTYYFPMRTDFYCNKNGASIFFGSVSLYALVRINQPKIIVETGGTPGKSSAFILRALQKNGKGRLYTVDHPPEEVDERFDISECHEKRPTGVRSNWAIPQELLSWQDLSIGKAKEVLPGLLEKIGDIDFFIHDSEHSYENMVFEFRQGWKFLRNEGLLWTDDVQANSAWYDFCREVNLNPNAFLHVASIQKK